MSINYNILILHGIISQLYNRQGIKNIKAITTGNRTVQQKDINWSNRILGKDALVHIKINIIIQDLRPKVNPYNNPSIKGSENILSLFKLFI